MAARLQHFRVEVPVRASLAILGAVLVLGVSSPVVAEAENAGVSRENRLSLGIAPVVFGIVPFEYERRLAPNFSVAVAATGVFPWWAPIGGVTLWGGGAGLSLRWWPWGSALSGLWVGPQGSWARMHGAVPDLEYTFDEATAVVMVGYTWMHDSGFTVSGGGGAGVGVGPDTFGSSNTGPRFELTGHLNLGWAF